MENAVKERKLMEQQAINAARARAAALFRRPEQLDKVQEHRYAIQREKTALDARIKALLEKNMDDYKDGVELLKSSQSSLDSIGNNFRELQKICAAQAQNIQEYGVIKEVNTTRNHLIYTGQYLDNIFTTNETAQQLSIELEDPRVNLLSVHTRTCQLERVRDELLYYVKNDRTQYREFTQYFSEVTKLSEKLENIMWSLLSELLDICDSAPKYIVSVMLIVHRETAMDKEVTNPAVKVDTSKRPKDYKKKAFNVIVNSIADRFSNAYVPSTTNENGEKVCGLKTTVENLRFIFKDLEQVKNKVVPCMPPDFDIFNLFLDNYNVRAREAIDSFVNPPLVNLLETSDVWLLMNYVEQYQNDMESRLEVSKERIAPPMLSGKTDLLRDMYMNQVKTKMTSWTRNILQVEWQEWFGGNREPVEPDTNEDGHYVSSLPVILFQMIDQQLSVASKTNKADFMFNVVKQCSSCLNHFHEEFERMLKRQGISCFSEQPNNEFFNEYMLLVVNNCSKCMKHTHHLATKLYDELDRSVREESKQQMLKVLQGFIRVSTTAYRLLIDVVYKDTAECMGHFFTKQWYQGDTQERDTIIATAEDYFSDFREHMVPEFFTKFVSETHTRFLLEYVQVLVSKNTRINPEKFGELFHSDMQKYKALFESNGAMKVLEKHESMRSLKELCEGSEEFVSLSYVDLKRRHPEFSFEILEVIMYKRDDLSRTARGEILATCKNTPIQGSDSGQNQAMRGFYNNIRLN